ncbi:MAG: sugar nucleotide-binding protein [Methylococcales bacterium]
MHCIFLSSELVFPSDSARVRCEHDVVGPETVYGRAKAEAERIVQCHTGPWTVLRSSTLYGYTHARRSNFSEYVRRALQSSRTVDAYSDVFSAPLFLADLSTALVHIVCERMVGVLHATGNEYLSRAEIANRIACVGGYDAALIRAVPRSNDIAMPRAIR